MKNFFKKLFGGLQVAAVPVEAILSMYNPPLGALVTSMINGIFRAEAKFGAGQGKSKAEDALSAVAAFGPMVMQLIEQSTGKNIVNDEEFAGGIEDLNNALVRILNAAGALPKPAAK